MLNIYYSSATAFNFDLDQTVWITRLHEGIGTVLIYYNKYGEGWNIVVNVFVLCMIFSYECVFCDSDHEMLNWTSWIFVHKACLFVIYHVLCQHCLLNICELCYEVAVIFGLWLWYGMNVMFQVSPTDYHRFIYKCHTCLLGFKRRGMLVNHLAKRHPDISPDSVPELNLPILKTTRDYYCQYCEKVNIIVVNH